MAAHRTEMTFAAKPCSTLDARAPTKIRNRLPIGVTFGVSQSSGWLARRETNGGVFGPPVLNFPDWVQATQETVVDEFRDVTSGNTSRQ